ncbi:MAG TPA: hypothetical protein VNI77_09690 [Nitrososphaera sp.]|nr:hypothetical protein [Nitrososphaera sp.]
MACSFPVTSSFTTETRSVITDTRSNASPTYKISVPDNQSNDIVLFYASKEPTTYLEERVRGLEYIQLEDNHTLVGN